MYDHYDQVQELRTLPYQKQAPFIFSHNKVQVQNHPCTRTITYYTSTPLASSSNSPTRKRLRKQLHPKRAPQQDEANFKGVTLTMMPNVGRSDTYLEIQPFFSSRKLRRLYEKVRKVNSTKRQFYLPDSPLPDISYGNIEPLEFLPPGKQCASCHTRKTPLWRDAEDGTPLCNACGIRFKKYRLRCLRCYYIPRKCSKCNSKCAKCGDVLRIRN